MTPLVVLVGPPGAGKTTVGQRLAERHGVAFRDTDRDIETGVGKSISDIFVEHGEQAFRAHERAAVAAALATHEGVLALGGGAVIADETRKALHAHRVVFLDVGLAAAVERVGLNTARPLLAVNPRAEVKRLLEARRPLYEEVATIVVSTDDRSADDVVDAIMSELVAHDR
jgi:shikimate kinase